MMLTDESTLVALIDARADNLILVVRSSTKAEVRCVRPLPHPRAGEPCNKLLQVIYEGTRGRFGFYCARCRARTMTIVVFAPGEI